MYGFVPSAGAVLGEWGADVIKVEHAVTGDPQRGLRQTGSLRVEGDPNPNIEHANRGKRSIGLDMSVPEGSEVLLELARRADVFLTSFLPGHRQKFGIDVDDIRAVNPKHHLRQGQRARARAVTESVKGGYDMTAFWCRAGTAATITPPGIDGMIGPPGPAYGDTISGTNLAGGIAAALLKRERTGEPSVVDVSLLGSGLWSMGHTVALTSHLGSAMVASAGRARLADQPAGRCVPDRRRPLHLLRHDAADEVLGRRVQAHGPRRTASTIRGSRPSSRSPRTPRTAVEILREAMAKRTLPEWSERFATLAGPWAPVQDTLQAAAGRAGPRQRVHRAGTVNSNWSRIRCSSTSSAPHTGPAPGFAEQTDEILLELGLDWDRIIELKTAGAVT